MIGLGSNRLTVCRRGGMSVTQAGKGGMEWLAGGRVPRWASPYSAQATAALKDAYPQYWSEIQQYGFDNPDVVPFVNANPIGWGGYIAYCNPAERTEISILHHVDTGIYGGSNIVMELDMYLDGNLFVVFDGGEGSNKRFNIQNNASYRNLRFDFGSTVKDGPQAKLTGRHTLFVDKGKLSVDGTQIYDLSGVTFTSANTIKIGTYIASLAGYIQYIYSGKIWDGDNNNASLRDMIPCTRKTDNQIGLWDLVSATFLPSTN